MQLDPDEHTHLCPVCAIPSPKSVLQLESRWTLHPSFSHSESVSVLIVSFLGAFGVKVVPFRSAELATLIVEAISTAEMPMTESVSLMCSSIGEPTRLGSLF